MDTKATLEHLQRLDAIRRQAGLARAAHLRAHLQPAAARLRTLGARRVVLFGSLARGECRAESDVDLAVEGLPSPALFEAMADLAELFGTHVDVVRIEDAPLSLRERIAAEGEPL